MRNQLLQLLRNSASNQLDSESIMLYFLNQGYKRKQTAGAIGNARRQGYISVAGKQYCASRNKMVNVFM